MLSLIWQAASADVLRTRSIPTYYKTTHDISLAELWTPGLSRSTIIQSIRIRRCDCRILWWTGAGVILVIEFLFFSFHTIAALHSPFSDQATFYFCRFSRT